MAKIQKQSNTGNRPKLAITKQNLKIGRQILLASTRVVKSYNKSKVVREKLSLKMSLHTSLLRNQFWPMCHVGSGWWKWMVVNLNVSFKDLQHLPSFRSLSAVYFRQPPTVFCTVHLFLSCNLKLWKTFILNKIPLNAIQYFKGNWYLKIFLWRLFLCTKIIINKK